MLPIFFHPPNQANQAKGDHGEACPLPYLYYNRQMPRGVEKVTIGKFLMTANDTKEHHETGRSGEREQGIPYSRYAPPPPAACRMAGYFFESM
jgi:hypothetical protein